MFKKIICYYIIIVCLNAYALNQYRFDYPYYPAIDLWLKFHKVPANFKDAFLRCKAEGSMLASPTTEQLRKVMMHLFESDTKACGIYTGIHATISKGVYTTIEGFVDNCVQGVVLEKLPIKWATEDVASDGPHENCVIMLDNGTVTDVSCNETYQYICYKKNTENSLNAVCGTIDKEYTFHHRTEHCYKFHRIGKTWTRAYMTCVAEGGYLAIINSPTEAEVIKDIFKQNPADKIQARFRDVASIGVYDWGEHGSWYTIHGETLEEAGYSKFSGGQPDNNTSYDGGSFCGGVFRNGLLDDLWCSGTTIPFICEKEPNSLLP